MDHSQLKTLIGSTLKTLGSRYASKDAMNLVYWTGHVESRYKYIKQLGTGPARSFWQVEPGMTGALDNVENYLQFRPKLAAKCAEATMTSPDVWTSSNQDIWDKILLVNMAAGIVHCRIKYWRSPLPMPGTLKDAARVWKTAYNTAAGKGTESKFIDMVSSLT